MTKKPGRPIKVDIENSHSFLLRDIPKIHWSEFVHLVDKAKKSDRLFSRIDKFRLMVKRDIKNRYKDFEPCPNRGRIENLKKSYLIHGIFKTDWIEFRSKCILSGWTVRERILELIWFEINDTSFWDKDLELLKFHDGMAIYNHHLFDV